MINPQTVKNATYNELSLHRPQSTNQSTERSKQTQAFCSFSRTRDVPSTLWRGFVYDSTSLRKLRRLALRKPERLAVRRNLLSVVPAGRNVLVPVRTAYLKVDKIHRFAYWKTGIIRVEVFGILALTFEKKISNCNCVIFLSCSVTDF